MHIENRTVCGDLFASFYLNGKDSLILAYGISSYVTAYHPIAKYCQDNSLNLFLPRYPGSLEAKGAFSLGNCKRALEQTIGLIRKGRAIELYDQKEISWDNTGKIYLLGFSFGALPALLAEVEGEKVELILNCPFVNLEMNSSEGKEAEKNIIYAERAYPGMFRFKAKDLIKEYRKVKYPENRQFTMLVGTHDRMVSEKEIEFLKEKYSPDVREVDGGHSIFFEELEDIIK